MTPTDARAISYLQAPDEQDWPVKIREGVAGECFMIRKQEESSKSRTRPEGLVEMSDRFLSIYFMREQPDRVGQVAPPTRCLLAWPGASRLLGRAVYRPQWRVDQLRCREPSRSGATGGW